MRQVGQFDHEKLALKFWSYLKRLEIDASLEEGDESKTWTIWVVDEDKLDVAFEEFDKFSSNPEDAKYLAPNPLNPAKEKDDAKKAPDRYKTINLRDKWSSSRSGTGTFTLALIITSVAVFLLSGMGKNTEIIGKFFISEKMNGELSEFKDGEIWRVITPIFIHGAGNFSLIFNLMHIVFNMYLLREFGSQIESLKGPKFFLTFVFLLALFSNMSQFWISGPAFGGMSGVNYGLFGYVWIKYRYDPGDGFRIDPTLALWLFGWFALGFVFEITGSYRSIANWAHAGGLALGLAWGLGSAYRWNRGKM